MPREASTRKNKPWFWRWLWRVNGLLFCLALSPALVGFSKAYMTCVRLPNGLLLDADAMWNPRRPLDSLTTLKTPGGALLVLDRISMMSFTATTVYGNTPDYRFGEGYAFAYRPDTGLVLEKEEPAAYARLVAEAGPVVDNDSPYFLYQRMIDDPAYRHVGCSQSLFTLTDFGGRYD